MKVAGVDGDYIHHNDSSLNVQYSTGPDGSAGGRIKTIMGTVAMAAFG